MGAIVPGTMQPLPSPAGWSVRSEPGERVPGYQSGSPAASPVRRLTVAAEKAVAFKPLLGAAAAPSVDRLWVLKAGDEDNSITVLGQK